MRVEIQRHHFVLKLYDHRFSAGLRREFGAQPFDAAYDKAYEAFVESGAASLFFDRWENDDDYCVPEDGLSLPEQEVFLHSVCLDMYAAECKVYDQLKDLQGTSIPLLFAKVTLRMPHHSKNGSMSPFYSVSGILLEHIAGFTIDQLSDKAPRGCWQEVCEQAIRRVQEFNQRNVLNTDIRSANFIVSPLSSSDSMKYRVVLIDFAQCRFRLADESDFQ